MLTLCQVFILLHMHTSFIIYKNSLRYAFIVTILQMKLRKKQVRWLAWNPPVFLQLKMISASCLDSTDTKPWPFTLLINIEIRYDLKILSIIWTNASLTLRQESMVLGRELSYQLHRGRVMNPEIWEEGRNCRADLICLDQMPGATSFSRDSRCKRMIWYLQLSNLTLWFVKPWLELNKLEEKRCYKAGSRDLNSMPKELWSK